MSKVKIQGNASGTGIFTVSSPNSNTDREITLPDGAGEILLSNGDGSNLTGLSAGGITEADTWRITADRTEASTGWNDFTGNFERADGILSGVLGTGMSQTSGVWTFPSTGYWKITGATTYEGTTHYDFVILSIRKSDDGGSNFVAEELGYTHAYNGDKNTIYTHAILKIEDTSNDVVKFSTVQSDSSTVTYKGSTNDNVTFFRFIKLADI